MPRTDGPPPGPAWLFCPGDRPDRYAKAAAAADVVILDLEDAVAHDAKASARGSVVAALGAGDLDPARVVVRINPLESRWGLDDLATLRDTDLPTVMLPKAAGVIDPAVFGHLTVVALCETARGITTAHQVAASAPCVAIAWGGQDLAADLGAPPLDASTGDLHVSGHHARMAVRFAAAAADIPAIDTVRTDVNDEEGLRREARGATEMGYVGKLVIHPRQVDPIREAFLPSDDDLAWARRVEQALETHDTGVLLVDGEMVDAPVVARARRTLARAGAPG
ncbi:HpcH/HpaI aldolase/citrate lyase family protein [Nitriliruptor alkaliphilus]|uniref:HpcH/HpaI aldolase/citrate lyase family protein n=1 Tax=Nitriliruptor alkaliphilus TaxID=427918 RepID=UPI0006972B7E|nr:CoA ester lyase [Nitriliruptor alkaliphilus]